MKVEIFLNGLLNEVDGSYEVDGVTLDEAINEVLDIDDNVTTLEDAKADLNL